VHALIGIFFPIHRAGCFFSFENEPDHEGYDVRNTPCLGKMCSHDEGTVVTFNNLQWLDVQSLRYSKFTSLEAEVATVDGIPNQVGVAIHVFKKCVITDFHIE
jgi:hypothetical protein